MKQLMFITICLLFLQGCNKQKPKTELDEVRGKWELVIKYLTTNTQSIAQPHLASDKLTVEINSKNEMFFRNTNANEFKLRIVKFEIISNSSESKIIKVKARDNKFQIYQIYFTYIFAEDQLKTMYYNPSMPLIFNEVSVSHVYNKSEGYGLYKRIL
jgi:hypothetical protein